MTPAPAPATLPPEDPVIATGTALGPELMAGVSPDVSFAVWQVLRTLRLWTAQPESLREGMFCAEYMETWERALLTGSLEPEIRFPLAVIVGELAAPAADAPRLSWACVCAADWALGRGAVRPGLAFAEAAALASPGQARYAWVAGRLMRTHGEGRAGERWLRRAYRVAVAQRDVETQARALTALGNLALQRGNYPAARAFHIRSLRIARRWKLREQEGMANHDLFAIAIHERKRTDADRYARAAVAAYSDSPRLPRLVHDIAYHWLCQGYANRARVIFEALRPHIRNADLRVRLVGNLGRAAAMLGDSARFEEHQAELRDLLPYLETHETVASALLELAYGAVSLGRWEIASELADAAENAARLHEEQNILIFVDQLQAAISRRDLSLLDEVTVERRASIPANEAFAAEMVTLLEEVGNAV